MDAFVISQVSYWWTRYKINPKQLVDKAIEIAVDILVPPKEDVEQKGPKIIKG